MHFPTKSPKTWLILGLLLVIGLMLLQIQKSYLIAYLPILLILICPLAMLFMAKNMSCHNDHQNKKSEKPTEE
jgi:uncharacterized membrane protein